MKTKTILIWLGVMFAIAPFAQSQSPAEAPPQYRRLEISRYQCESLSPTSLGANACSTLKEAGKIVWPYAACNGWLNGPAAPEAACLARGKPRENGTIDDIQASCNDNEFKRAARECMRSHRLKAEGRGDTTPVCLSIHYSTGRKGMSSSISELAECPPDGFVPTLPAGN